MSKAVQKVEITTPAVPATSESGALISMIERAARDPSVDITKMERLFEMHQRVQVQQAKTAYLAALAKLQAELPAVERKGKGHNEKRYARFEDFIEAVKEHLTKHGFSLTFRIKQEPAIIRIAGILGHEAGHQEETELALPADTTGNKNAVQAWGSSISYGKRYVGMTLLGIATEDEDDDGTKAGALADGGLITEAQVEELQGLIMSTKTNISIFYRMWGIDNLTALPAAQFKPAKAFLEIKQEMRQGQ